MNYISDAYKETGRLVAWGDWVLEPELSVSIVTVDELRLSISGGICIT